MFYTTYSNPSKCIKFSLYELYYNGVPYEEIETITINFTDYTSIHGLYKCINLRILYCTHNNKLEYLPDIKNLTKLEIINISLNNIIKLPNLNKLTNLEYLNCNYNKLIKLPNLNNNIQLKYLSCSYNNLSCLPDLSNNIQLERLYCCNNNIKSIPINIINCKNLRIRNLKNKYTNKKYDYHNNLPGLINKIIYKYYYEPILNDLNNWFLN